MTYSTRDGVAKKDMVDTISHASSTSTTAPYGLQRFLPRQHLLFWPSEREPGEQAPGTTRSASLMDRDGL